MTAFAQLTLFHGAMFGALALLCACIYMAMRSHKAIVWLGCALLCATMDTVMLSLLAGTGLEPVALIVLLPATYICYAGAVRHATHYQAVHHQKGHIHPGQHHPGQRHLAWHQAGLPALDRAVAGLSCLALLLCLTGLPYGIYALPFLLACGLTIGESGMRIFRARSHHVLDIDNALAGCLAALAGIYLARLVAFPVLFGLNATYAEVKGSSFETTLSIAAAVLTAPACVLLLGRIIGTSVAGWRNKAERDYMTGLLSREAFERMATAADAHGGAVVFCDLDDFKGINDRFGHHGGDQVIRAFGSLLARSGHIAGRLGGDEFAVVLKGADGPEAVAVAEGIRQDFHGGSLPGIPSRERLGASFGIATFPAGMPPIDAFRDADAALYRAKENGRNRVYLCNDADRAAKVVPIAGSPATAFA